MLLRLFSLCAFACVFALTATGAAAGVERLYVIDCGEGTVGDISRWSPGVNEGQSMPFVTSCYVIKHSAGWMLWDTGLDDAVADLTDGQKPADPRLIHWRKSRKLSAQLAELGLKPHDIRFVAISHSHGDHIGNIALFPESMLLVQQAEYEWPSPAGPRFKSGLPVTKLDGERDVFGDGSVVIFPTPGHTPGHQSLLVKLLRTGALVLSGDATHFIDNWNNRRVPSFNVDEAKTRASMQRIAEILEREKAQLWINHDRAQRATLKLAPAYYD